MTNKQDKVIFRRFKGLERDIIALLPEYPANKGKILSYQVIGQHSESDYPYILDVTVPCTYTEYRDLLEELKSIEGYI